MKKTCAFCTKPEIKKRVVYEDKLVFAFPTYIPITPGHMLLCPVRCVSTISELTAEELLALFALRERITSGLKRAFGAEGFNCAWNEGEVAGQDVLHLHLHVVPRKQDDTGITEYEPRKFLYRPGSRDPSPEQELESVSELVKEAFL